MHLLAALLLLLLGVLCRPARAALAENRFRRPPASGPTGDYRDNPVYAIGDRVDLQWETSLKSVDLVLWQAQPDGNTRPAYARLVANAKAKSLAWTVGYDGFPEQHDPDLSPVYYLQLFEAGGDPAGNATSHYFNITGPASAARTTTTTTARLSRTTSVAATTKKATAKTTTTARANTTTSTSTTAAAGQATPTTLAPESDGDSEAATASPTPTPTATSAPAPAAGLPGSTVAGIAVCAVLGGLAVLGGAGWAMRRRGLWRGRGRGVAHSQGDIVMYAERQLREKGAVAWRTPPSPLQRQARLPVEREGEGSREALAFELEAAEPVAGAAAAGWGGDRSVRSGSSGWRSMGWRSWG